MDLASSIVLPKGCRLIELPCAKDDRGALAFCEEEKHIPFEIRRVFWIYGVPEGKSRGGHSHSTCHEFVVPVSGSFVMTVDDGAVRCDVKLDDPCVGILIPAGVWCELKQFEPGTVLLVSASQEYDSTGYIHDYGMFKEKAQLG